MLRYFFVFFFFVIPFPLKAIDVGEVTSFIFPTTHAVAKEIKNTAHSARMVSVEVARLSSPQKGGNIIQTETPDELLMTPSRILLQPQSSDIVRFYYNGPNDDKERYYRIYWTEQALTDDSVSSSQKNAIATTSVRIGTILVVTPRQENFSWKFTGEKVINNGNVSFRLIAYGPCLHPKNGQPECREKHNIMPGDNRAFTRVDVKRKQSRIAIWHGNEFISVK
ncbi:EcpB family pilus assembly chaperone [Erwinia oleae]|uniref:EcpB family pilus assembly chaperone n=1 Tax=Erwinia oleae TaxID=796334 RepID=UPI00054D7E18|nr:fimbria/pilus periplasmic chaperone [Erwinia oleae]